MTKHPVTPVSQSHDDDGDQGQSLYADHVKVYPRSVQGFYRRLKWSALAILLGIYYLAPWLRWDRGPNAPDQAILIDLPGRRAYFFSIEIWPQEVYYITGLLILGAVGLFLATALLGRVWCGFACPQTVWTDLYLWVERKIEGERNARRKLDRGSITFDWIVKKTIKHALWLIIALLTGGAWVWYFVDAPVVTKEIFTGEAGPNVYGFIALFTATTYLLAGWAREQVCIYMCPWPRFQGAMFDEDSLIVTYESWRGEPRGGAKRGSSFEGRGHCVDCRMCVHVCPTGTDIRLGPQLSCIGCALCVDACNGVMAKFGLPPGLITYDSIANQNARSKSEPTRIKLVRSRTVIYSAILAVVGLVMVGALAMRKTLDISVLHDRSPLFVPMSDGRLKNGYTLKILNMVRETKTFRVGVDNLPGAEIHLLGAQEDGAILAEPDAVASYQMFVYLPRTAVREAKTNIVFTLTDAKTGQSVRHGSFFAGPDY